LALDLLVFRLTPLRQIAEATEEHTQSAPAVAVPAQPNAAYAHADTLDEHEDSTLDQLMQEIDSQAAQSNALSAGPMEGVDLDTQPGAKRARDEPLSAQLTLDDDDDELERVTGDEKQAPPLPAACAKSDPLRLVIAPSPDLESDTAERTGDYGVPTGGPDGRTAACDDANAPTVGPDGSIAAGDDANALAPKGAPQADGATGTQSHAGDAVRAADFVQAAAAQDVDGAVEGGREGDLEGNGDPMQSQIAQSDVELRLSLSPSLASSSSSSPSPLPQPQPQLAPEQPLARDETGAFQTQLADYQPSSPMEVSS
jgi:hypothetical protein